MKEGGILPVLPESGGKSGLKTIAVKKRFFPAAGFIMKVPP